MSTTNLTQIAYEHLREQITLHKLKENIVYSERKLSSEIGISRTPLHAALQQLELEGYVDVLPSRGFCLHKMSKDDIAETFQMRAAIELYCSLKLARDAHAHLKKADMAIESLQLKTDELFDYLVALRSNTADLKEFVACDLDFHNSIVSYVGNGSFNDLFTAHQHKIKDLALDSLGHPGRLEQTVLQHRAILSAIKKDDETGLLAALRTHVDSAQALNLADVK